MSKEHAMRTRLIHGDKHEMNPFGSLQMPIFQTSTYQFESTKQGADRFAGKEPGYIYARLGSPSTTQIEEKLAIRKEYANKANSEIAKLKADPKFAKAKATKGSSSKGSSSKGGSSKGSGSKSSSKSSSPSQRA